MNRLTGIIACLAGLLAVVLGAFGAHALKDRLLEAETLDVWQTAVDYQMWHALALLLCVCLPKAAGKLRATTLLFTVGILLFSGSLYWLALDGPDWLGPITPMGGLSFMAGWIALGLTIFRGPSDSPGDE